VEVVVAVNRYALGVLISINTTRRAKATLLVLPCHVKTTRFQVGKLATHMEIFVGSGTRVSDVKKACAVA
jgi:hypothetical protein